LMEPDRRPGPSDEFVRYSDDLEDRSIHAKKSKHAKRARYLIRAAASGRPLKDLDILDAGCGEGLLLSMLPEGNRLFGFDASRRRLDEDLAGGRAEISVQDIYATSYSDGRFDMVFCSQVLEHLERPTDALVELARVCRPGGVVCLSVPYDEKVKYETCVHCGKPTPLHGHLHRFNEKNVGRFIPAALGVLEIGTVCNNAVHMRLHRLPFFAYRLLDVLATRVLRISKPRWLYVLCRKEGAA